MATESDIRGLMRDYTPLAVQIANGFKRRLPPHVQLDDLRAAAMAGLWDAVRLRPDAEHFESYARIRISGAIKDDLRSRDWLPRFFRERNPGQHAIVVHMNELVEGSLTADDDVESQAAASISLKAVRKAVESLSPRHRMVFMERTTTAREAQSLAEELGVTQARVSQIYGEALDSVREAVGLPKIRVRRRPRRAKD